MVGEQDAHGAAAAAHVAVVARTHGIVPGVQVGGVAQTVQCPWRQGGYGARLYRRGRRRGRVGQHYQAPVPQAGDRVERQRLGSREAEFARHGQPRGQPGIRALHDFERDIGLIVAANNRQHHRRHHRQRRFVASGAGTEQPVQRLLTVRRLVGLAQQGIAQPTLRFGIATGGGLFQKEARHLRVGHRTTVVRTQPVQVHPRVLHATVGGAQQQGGGLAQVAAYHDRCGGNVGAWETRQRASELVGGAHVRMADAVFQCALDLRRGQSRKAMPALLGKVDRVDDELRQLGGLGAQPGCGELQAPQQACQVGVGARLAQRRQQHRHRVQSVGIGQGPKGGRGGLDGVAVALRHHPGLLCHRDVSLRRHFEPDQAPGPATGRRHVAGRRLDLRHHAAGTAGALDRIQQARGDQLMHRQVLGQRAQRAGVVAHRLVGEVFAPGGGMARKTALAQQITPTHFATGVDVARACGREQLNVLTSHVDSLLDWPRRWRHRTSVVRWCRNVTAPAQEFPSCCVESTGTSVLGRFHMR